MLTVLTILAVAVTDLIRLAQPYVTARAMHLVQLAWWLALAVAAGIWVRPEGWAGAAAVVVAAAWYYSSQRMSGSQLQQRPPAVMFAWSGIGLIASIAGLAWLDVVVLDSSAPIGLMWIALALFLTQTGNQVTRAVLMLSGRETGHSDAAGAVPNSRLKGGRVIGPLERIFIMVLTVVGAYHVVAALMAAKGIVRFPEISADAKRDPEESTAGTKAEEFLVGSLASWGLAGGAGLLAAMFA